MILIQKSNKVVFFSPVKKSKGKHLVETVSTTPTKLRKLPTSGVPARAEGEAPDTTTTPTGYLGEGG